MTTPCLQHVLDLYVAVPFETSGSGHSALSDSESQPPNYSDQCSGACSGMRAPRQLSGQTANQFSKANEFSKVRLSKREVFVCLASGSDAPKVQPSPILDFSVLLFLICGAESKPLT